DRSYDEVELALVPDDMVVFTTDGIDESVDASGRELGRERVGAALLRLGDLPAREIAAGLLAACRRHSGEDEPADDRTILVLRLAAG
ncbi:MAG TPA: SpoIIE family protein phosphatase, partial [Thermoanaerobaculia bacterium]|nr:SpoIIE family protein phosphatase [Thermoanaerobaculia bacterium]